jgi:hypothetical protein
MNASPVLSPLTDRTQPLLRRSALLPDESLASLLERLAQLNFYPNSKTVTSIYRARLVDSDTPDDLMRPTRLETFEQLACLTQVSPDDLYAASDHGFAPILTPPGVPPTTMAWTGATTKPLLPSRWARLYLRPVTVAQFCPRCLKAAPYQRLSWVPRAAAVCLEHQCILLDRCRHCYRPISVKGLVTHQCEDCKADLRRMPAVSVTKDTLGLLSQRVIQCWLAVANPPDLVPDPHLPVQPPEVLYELLDNLAQRLLEGQAAWPQLPDPLRGLANPIAASITSQQALTPGQAYFLYRSAFAGLLNWPQGLFKLLDAYSGYAPSVSPSPSRSDCLRVFQHAWLDRPWPHQSLEFVQPCLVDYLLARGLFQSPNVVERFQTAPWFMEQTGLWTKDETMRVLGLSQHNYDRFAEYGVLCECRWRHSQSRFPLFERDKVLAVQQRWASGWSLSDVSTWLGLRSDTVLRLVDLGALTPTVTPLDPTDEAGYRFDQQLVKKFFDTVARSVVLYEGARCDLASLDQAAYVTEIFDITDARLLQEVARGRVPAYKGEPTLKSLGGLKFLEVNTILLPDLIYAERGWVAGHRFAYEQGFSPQWVWTWLAEGLIKPVAIFDSKCRYFMRTELEQLWAHEQRAS